MMILYMWPLFEKIQHVAQRLWENHQQEISGLFASAFAIIIFLVIMNEKN